MAERHEHAESIQKKNVAIILTVPLSQLRPNGNLSATTQSRVALREVLKDLGKLAHHYFTHYANTQFKKHSAKTSTKASSKKSASASSKKGSKKRPYTEDEKDDDYKLDEPNRARETKKAVLVRDGNACVFLRTSNPEVAHIIPVSWNMDAGQIEKTSSLMPAI
ncbi:hypothetical protein CEK27_003862 [Fusarium fujikuroi]|nr:hypothetical protein CEK27_003862 [Fusarium fujikuroi]QGI77095.1 hypothetical protein CEK25_003824 [Fusarium fujikuroi]